MAKSLRQRYIEGWRRWYDAQLAAGEITQHNVNVNIDALGSWGTDHIIARSKELGIEPVPE